MLEHAERDEDAGRLGALHEGRAEREGDHHADVKDANSGSSIDRTVIRSTAVCWTMDRGVDAR